MDRFRKNYTLEQSKHYLGNKTYYIRYRDKNGNDKRISTHETAKVRAQKFVENYFKADFEIEKKSLLHSYFLEKLLQ